LAGSGFPLAIHVASRSSASVASTISSGTPSRICPVMQKYRPVV
jgi:hypothetical protein